MILINFVKKHLRKYYNKNDAFIKKLRREGAKVGQYVQIIDGYKFLYEPWYANLIEIGDGVVISAGVRFVTHDSSYANIIGNLPVRYGKIIIGKNSYIGVNTVVLPGVVIGEHSLIGASSLVNKNIPPYSVAAGNPIKILYSLNEGANRYKEKISNKNQENVYFLDFIGSYQQMKEKWGDNIINEIIKKYSEYKDSGMFN